MRTHAVTERGLAICVCVTAETAGDNADDISRLCAANNAVARGQSVRAFGRIPMHVMLCV